MSDCPRGPLPPWRDRTDAYPNRFDDRVSLTCQACSWGFLHRYCFGFVDDVGSSPVRQHLARLEHCQQVLHLRPVIGYPLYCRRIVAWSVVALAVVAVGGSGPPANERLREGGTRPGRSCHVLPRQEANLRTGIGSTGPETSEQKVGAVSIRSPGSPVCMVASREGCIVAGGPMPLWRGDGSEHGLELLSAGEGRGDTVPHSRHRSRKGRSEGSVRGGGLRSQWSKSIRG